MAIRPMTAADRHPVVGDVVRAFTGRCGRYARRSVTATTDLGFCTCSRYYEGDDLELCEYIQRKDGGPTTIDVEDVEMPSLFMADPFAPESLTPPPTPAERAETERRLAAYWEKREAEDRETEAKAAAKRGEAPPCTECGEPMEWQKPDPCYDFPGAWWCDCQNEDRGDNPQY